MKDVASRIVTIMVVMVLLVSGCGARDTDSDYANPAWGLSMWYPEDWVYEEGESHVTFATSEQVVTGEESGTGAWMAVDPLEPTGQGLGAVDLETVCVMIVMSFAEADLDRWDISDPQPRNIGGRDGCEITFEDREAEVRGFVAGTANERWGYLFYGGSAVDEWPEHGPDLQTMLDSVQFTTPPRLTPTVTPTATPTVTSGPIATPQALAGTPVPRTEAAISPENADQVTQLARWGRTEGVLSLAFAPDGKSLASVSGGELELWRVSDGTVCQTLQGQTASVGPVAFSTDRQTVASVCSESTVRLWRVNDGELLQSIDVDPGGVFVASSVAFSPDLQVLASGSSGGPVQLRRMTDATLLHTFSGHSGTVTGLAFSPNGEILASVSSSGGVQLCRVSDGEPVRTLKVRDLGIPSEVVFSPDGHTLAVVGGYGTLQLWRVTDGALLRTLDAHPEWVNSVAFSPDGRTLASASSDSTIRLWRVSDGALLHTLRGHTDSVSDVAFSPDGAILASGSLDGTIRVWGIPGR